MLKGDQKTMQQLRRIGFGGGCHWCTEAVFEFIKGVYKVEQGFIASDGENSSYSEAVIVHYNPSQVSIKGLIAIHLHTHNSTALHSMRNKYRSAVYSFSEDYEFEIVSVLKELQADFEKKIITQVLVFGDFKASYERFKNYYTKDIEKPFCKTHIQPKLRLLVDKFSGHVKHSELKL